MKKLIYLFVIFMVVVSCKKDNTTTPTSTALNPVQKQWGFVLEYTAQWCGPCGQWGAPTMTTLCAVSPNVVGVACHAASGDAMNNSALYSSFYSDRTDGGGIPHFWVGDQNNNYATSAMTTLLAQTCTAAVDLNYTRSGNTITVNTQSKFFANGTGNYYLSVLVLESGINGSASAPTGYPQNGTTDANYTHKHVLRASAITGKAYGESIVNGTVKVGQTINKSYTITLDPTWTKTINVCAILWNYDATVVAPAPKYKYVNCVEK